jgi:thioredoxin 1
VGLRTCLHVAAVAMSFAAMLTPARAGDMLIFSEPLFERTKREGRPFLVETYSTGCPVCWIQESTIRQLVAKPPYDRMPVLVIDAYDRKEHMRLVGAQTRSTLIVYRGNQEIARAVGITAPDAITALLDRGLWSADVKESRE